MLAQSEFLSQLQLQSHKAFQRNGVVIYGDADWQNALIADFHQKQQNQTWFCVGEWQLENALCVNTKQGNMLLGRECDVLLFDARKELDANSFTSALGALVGGGLLIVVANKNQDADEAEHCGCKRNGNNSLLLRRICHYLHCQLSSKRKKCTSLASKLKRFLLSKKL
jgi:tRNA(Met) cytidine acetyltransferase